MIKKISGIVSTVLIVAIITSCASVIHTWETYPIGTDLEVREKRIVYVAPVEDLRSSNITVATEEPVPGDICKINEYNQIFYVEDPEMQKATAFLASAIKQDLRDAGFELTTIENQADFVLKTGLISMEASKLRNMGSAVLASVLLLPTFGASMYFIKDDVEALCTFKTSIVDTDSGKEVSSREYTCSEKQKQRVFIEGKILNPGYFLSKCIKSNVQQMISELITVSE